MIYGVKDRLLSIIFSILLAVSILIFTVSAIAIPSGKAAAHNYKKISCEITRKENKKSEVVLYYTIYNDTKTDINSLNITTKVSKYGDPYGSFDTTFSDYGNGIEKKSESYFSVSVSYYTFPYSVLSESSLNSLDFDFILTSVSFSDYVEKTNLDYKMSSPSK